MKVLCLGGSGGMGRYTTKAIVNFEELETITIADLNKDAAEDIKDLVFYLHKNGYDDLV